MFRSFFAALLCAVLVCLSTVSGALGASVVDRSEYTTTTQVAPGQLRTTVSPQPLNFESEDGAWKPLDLQLDERGDGSLEPGAVDGQVVIPPALSQPIEVEHSGREVSFRLKGASGEAEVDDATAVFDDAMPGVDVQYEATPRGVKERLILAGASGPTVFAYDVRAGASWSAVVDGRGEVVLRDGAGIERYRVTAPLAWDSAADPAFTNDLKLSVTKVSAGRWTVTLRPSLAWLQDPVRTFPVVLDPDFSWSNGTTHFHGAQDCYLSGNTQANNTFCAQTYLQTGYFNRPYKSIFKFNIAAAIPTNAVVSAATFKAYAPPASARASGNHRLHTITSDWDSTATWNNRKPGVPWTTAGGDISANSSYSSSAPTAVQALSTWFTFPAPVAAVQGWVAGTLPNYGFLLSTDAGAPANQAYAWASSEASTSSSFPATSNEWPTLDVTWSVPDTTAPALTLSGPLSTGQTAWRTADTGDITLAGTDAGTGVKRVEVLKGSTVLASDTQSCPAGACSMNRTFALDLAGLGEGIHTLTAAAVDGGNLRGEQTFTVRVDRADPGLALTGTLVDDEAQPAQTGTRNMHVEATDTGAGIVDLTMKVDGVVAEHVTQTCAAGACSRTEDWSVDVGALGDGTHQVQIIATDGAGRTKSQTLEIAKEAYPMPDAPPLSDTSVTPFPDQVDFLYQGPEAVQTGLDPEILEERRTGVVTGKVFNDAGVPAAGVSVSVVDHPEFGQTVSRENGQFFLVVNGGAQLRIRYEVQGALPAERQVETKWNDYVWVEDVWLVSQDPVGTPVEFGTSVGDPQLAEASEVSDQDGERTPRVYVRPGTQAWKEKTNGSLVPLTAGTVRISEYTVGSSGPERMPAELPHATAYTWAAEFQVDEATAADDEHVKFSKPVVAYLENFVGLPVGDAVPVGTYEWDQGEWIGDVDGRVIEILSESGGKAVIDVTGFGALNSQERAQFGIDDAELEMLADTYAPGDQLWRVELASFSTKDFNKPSRKKKRKPRPTNPDNPDCPDGCKQPGSIIGVQDQTLGETADLGGTPYMLRYQSERTPAASGMRSIRVPMTDETVDADLFAVDAEVQIAGQRLSYRLEDPEPNIAHTFRWDGRDAFDRQMVGGAVARVQLSDAYLEPYSSSVSLPVDVNPDDYEWVVAPFYSSGGSVSWGSVGDSPGFLEAVFAAATPSVQPVDRPNLECNADETRCWYPVDEATDLRPLPQGRETTAITNQYAVQVPYLDARSMGVGGWGVSAQHRYDTGTGTLYTGDGQQRSVDSLPLVIDTVRDHDGTDNPPQLQQLSSQDMTLLPDGSALRVEGKHIYRDWPDGHTTIFAGDANAPAGSGNGGQAIDAGFSYASTLAYAPDGSVYVGDVTGSVVRRIAPDGVISHVIGTGDSSDGAVNPRRGIHTAVYFPRDLAVANDGTLYIASASGLHQVAPDGVATRLAGVPSWGCEAEGDPCRILAPPARQVAVAPDGTVYFSAEHGNGDTVNYLYRYKPGEENGTLLGTTSDNAENVVEGPFNGSGLNPAELEVDRDGRLWIVSGAGTRKIYRLEADSTIKHIGIEGCSDRTPDQRYVGESGPFFSACGAVNGLALGPDGMYTLEDLGKQIRRVQPALTRYPAGESLVPSDDGSEVYRFNEAGRHLETLDGRTERVTRTFSYDVQGRLSAVNETDLGSTTFAYAPAGGATVTGPDGQQTQIDVNTDGWATRITDADSAEQQYQYAGAGGLMTSYENQLGHETQFTWSPTGRLLTDTTPRGGSQTLARTESDLTALVAHTTAGGQTATYAASQADGGSEKHVTTAPDGTQTTGTVDRQTGQIAAEFADGVKTTSRRSGDARWGASVPTGTSTTVLPSGLAVTSSHTNSASRSAGQNGQDPFDYDSIIDTFTVNGRTTTSTYDRDERTDTTTSPMGRTSQVEYDEDDRPVRISAPAREDVEIEYDARGRPITASQGDVESTTTYGADGRVASATDAEGGVTTVARDALGRPTTVTGPDDEDTAFDFDAAGQLSSVTAPDGRAFAFEYDDNGNQTQMTRPARTGSGDASLVSTRVYDSQDRVTSRTRPSGEQVTTTYDPAGRLTEREASDGTSAGASYEPVVGGDGGRLQSLDTAEGASTELDYDGSLLTGVQSFGDAWTGDATGDQPAVELGYDASLRLSSEEVDGESVGYSYNNDDQATQIGDVSLAYDAVSGDPQTIAAGETSTQIDLDTRGDLEALASSAEVAGVAAPVLSESVVRDDLGRITQRTETIGAGPADVYGYFYDLAGRLTQVTKNAATVESYAYDSTGGLTSRGSGPLSSWIATDGHGRPTETADGTELAWSPDGELLTLSAAGGAETQFAYDGFGRLVQVTLPGGEVGRYRYDAAGRRTAVRLDGTMVRRFVYGGAEFPRARVDADGDVLERYVYASYEHVPDLIVRRDGQRLRLITDTVGSVRAAVDADTGLVVQRLAYDAYGRVTQDTAPGTQPFGYKGALIDPVAQGAGLVWMGVRAYLPALGRFATPDPAGLAAGWNQHDALGGDPVNLIDADGRFSIGIEAALEPIARKGRHIAMPHEMRSAVRLQA